ncbi:AMP-binding protein [Pseudomonas aeruginosa]|nr:AMP-binding protein [Pseudomonas aeruginosa]
MSTLANLTEVLFRLDFDPDTAVYHYRGQTLSRLQCRTYILSQASQLARLLKPGDRVVLALNDSPSLACLFLACIAVGAIPAVINPKSREQALADIAADCQASLVVREADAPSLSGPLAPLTLRAAAGRPLLDDFSLDALVGPADLDWSAFHRQDPAAACFLQYTSGSTGAPKGGDAQPAQHARFLPGVRYGVAGIAGGRPAVFDSQDVLRLWHGQQPVLSLVQRSLGAARRYLAEPGAGSGEPGRLPPPGPVWGAGHLCLAASAGQGAVEQRAPGVFRRLAAAARRVRILGRARAGDLRRHRGYRGRPCVPRQPPGPGACRQHRAAVAWL